MNEHDQKPSDSASAATQLILRWAASVEMGPLSLRVAFEIEKDMRSFARQYPMKYAGLVSGVLHDLPLDPELTRMAERTTAASSARELSQEAAQLCILAAVNPYPAAQFLLAAHYNPLRFGPHDIAHEALRWSAQERTGLESDGAYGVTIINRFARL